MKTKVILLAILNLGIILTSCEKDELSVFPSAKVTTKNLSVSNIDELEVSSLFNVIVNFSETEGLAKVEANENIHELIEIEKVGNRLLVGLVNNSRIKGEAVLNLYLNTSTLSRIQADGASRVEFESTLNANKLELNFGGASFFEGDLIVDELISNLTGASKMNISGNSNSFEINGEGASEMIGFDFVANILNANLEGASEISITVNQILNVTASGASTLLYKGNGLIENQSLKDASMVLRVD